MNCATNTSPTAAVLLLLAVVASPWTSSSVRAFSFPTASAPLRSISIDAIGSVGRRTTTTTTNIATLTVLSASSEEDAEPASATMDPSMSEPIIPSLTDEDRTAIRAIYEAGSSPSSFGISDDESMEVAAAAALDRGLHPRLVVALQIKAASDDDYADDDDAEFEVEHAAVAAALQSVLDARLSSGRALLKSFLDAGEIRKLDSAIGRAAKNGELDMGFFNVLDTNMRDAALDKAASSSATPEGAFATGMEDKEGETGANRAQILRHIHTRCQEELEKNVPPGAGLLNKLLRTEQSAIRSNQLSHYLGPQKTSITSPDGTVIELDSTGKPLVTVAEFVGAMSDAVLQIRTVEAAGGTDRMTAANLVEAVRVVAREGRLVLIDDYGEDSEELKELQDNLQPVFRPASASSEYARGSQ